MSKGEPPIKRTGRAIGMAVALRALLGRGRRARVEQPPDPLRDRSGHPVGPPPSEGDLDPAERTVPANRRAEGIVAGLLAAAALCAFGFTALYAADGPAT